MFNLGQICRNSARFVLYEFFDCSTNTPRGLSAYNLNIIYIYIFLRTCVFMISFSLCVRCFCVCKSLKSIKFASLRGTIVFVSLTELLCARKSSNTFKRACDQTIFKGQTRHNLNTLKLYIYLFV